MKISHLPEAQRVRIIAARKANTLAAPDDKRAMRAALEEFDEVVPGELEADFEFTVGEVVSERERNRFAHILPLEGEPAKPTGAAPDATTTGPGIAFPAQGHGDTGRDTWLDAIDAQQKSKYAHIPGLTGATKS